MARRRITYVGTSITGGRIMLLSILAVAEGGVAIFAGSLDVAGRVSFAAMAVLWLLSIYLGLGNRVGYDEKGLHVYGRGLRDRLLRWADLDRVEVCPASVELGAWTTMGTWVRLQKYSKRSLDIAERTAGRLRDQRNVALAM